MKSTLPLSLSEQRQALCGKLQAQRERIAQQLGPGAAAPRAYPRSMTMRLLGQRPGMIVSLLSSAATLFRHR